MTRAYGSKYDGNYRNAADIAKDMRADIKALQQRGQLPRDLKVSVTVDNYSMGRSIDMRCPYRAAHWVRCIGIVPGSEDIDSEGAMSTARGCPDPQHQWSSDYQHDVLSIEGQRVRALLAGIHGVYNYDGSDVMTDYFDVNYYGTVTMQDRRSAEWAEREKARKAEQRKNAKAKAELIDHLLTEHLPMAKRGQLRPYTYERLVKNHDALHAKAEQ